MTAKTPPHTPRQRIYPDSSLLKERFPTHFAPNWRKRALVIVVIAGLVGLYGFGLTTLEISLQKMIEGMGKFGWIIGVMLPPHPGSLSNAWVFMHGVVETLAMALLGTLGGALLAFPFGFLAAKNVVGNKQVHVLTRRFLDIVRGVDTLIWALIWIGVVGLGPFAGVLAIMTSDFGAFGKLFSEAIESADKKPVEGVLSTGGKKMEAVRFGIVPQILPIIASQVLYYFESNTRSATIIGIVGAGGIGLYLTETIRTLEWQQASFIVVLVLITVAVIDFISSKLRTAIIGAQAR